MQLHEIKPIHRKKHRRRVGRGGKKGTYSGRGMKGQKSRAGGRFKPIIRELIKRYPKLRGYRQKSTHTPKIEVGVNLEILEKKLESGQKVSPEILQKYGLVSKILGRTPKVKILGRGEITKALNFENCEVSKSAKEKIEKAGGTVKHVVSKNHSNI